MSRRIDEQLDQALEDGLRLYHQLNDIVYGMRDAMGGTPSAQSYDGVRAARSVLWCWAHEREVAACLKDDLDCTGETIAVDDQTGEAATDHDKARADHRELVRRIGSIARDVDWCVGVAPRYLARTATEKERKATEKANEPGCEVCLRGGTHTPPKVLSSTVKGNLPRPYRLCGWHLDFVLATGRLPTDDEERAHQEGRRVRLKAS